MATLNLLYKKEYSINDFIHVMIPTVGEVIEHEEEYYNDVMMLTAMPIDFMVQLDDIGLDFEKLNDWELFLLLFNGLKERDTSLIFGDLDLKKFGQTINTHNNTMLLMDKESGAKIDRAIYGQISSFLRKIHHLERNNRKPGNEAAKKYMIQRAREKMRRHRKRSTSSQLEQLIVALVNTSEFPYDFDSVLDLTIYQFNESVQQVIKKVGVDYRMIGVYAGTVSAKTLSQDELNWLVH